MFPLLTKALSTEDPSDFQEALEEIRYVIEDELDDYTHLLPVVEQAEALLNRWYARPGAAGELIDLLQDLHDGN